jgi:tRNA A-37 threonylcarbamoyl transferase component Bud32
LVTVPGYQIERLLNWGSQGDVFLATDASGRRFALKVVTGDRCDGDVQAVERLRREARLLAAIRSQHVVGVHGLIESEDWCCLVLEYLQGQTLDVAVREHSGLADATRAAMASTVLLSPDQAGTAAGAALDLGAPAVVPAKMQTGEHIAWVLELMVQLTRGVSELHAIRLVHRDLKPQNAMLVDGRVVLIDFGFARMDGVTTVTQSGTAIGTLAFMGPELFRGGAPTMRGDVYGLGAVAWFCLTGGPPVGRGVKHLADLGRRCRPPSLRRQNGGVSPAIAAVLERALEPDPRDRHQDAGELLDDLQRCQRGEPVHVPFRWGRAWRHHRRRVAVVMATMVLAVLSVAAFAGFDADRLAGRLLAQVLQDPANIAAQWQACDEPQRDQITVELNRRLGNDVQKAMALAQSLNLGLLRVGGRANHSGVLLPTTGLLPPQPPPLAEFLPLDEPRCLLVRPGRAWCLVSSRDPLGWWGTDDPLCLQMLLDVQVPAGDVVERPLDVLPTDLPRGVVARAVRIPAGKYPSRNAQNNPTNLPIGRPFVVDAYESSGAVLSMFRKSMFDRKARRTELDAWIRHPDEPPEVADALWSRWTREAKAHSADHMPARLTFWEAHRLATFFGFRLPAYPEWLVVSRDGDKTLGNDEQRRIPAEEAVRPVDAEPAWDVTERGVVFANSNVAEWTLTRTRDSTKHLFSAVPARVKAPMGLLWAPFPALVDKSDPAAEHGLRLYRTALQGP